MKLIDIVRPMLSKKLQEDFTDDRKFEVFESRLKDFLKQVAKNKFLSVTKKVKDGGYYNVTVFNRGPAENWDDLIDYYKSKIKI